MRVVGNLLNSRRRIAQGLAIAEDALADRLVEPRSPPSGESIRVVVESAPCQEHEVRDPDLAVLPIPHFFEHEGGPTSPQARSSPATPRPGRRNWSIARIRPLGGARALVGIAPNHHLAVLARAAAERGERLPIAVAIGLHPALLVAACLYLRLGEDELEVAGRAARRARRARALPHRCRSRSPRTPSSCWRGMLDAADDRGRGPRVRVPRHVRGYGQAATATFTCLTRRDDAVLQVIEPGYHPEHVLLGAVAIAAGLEHALREVVPAVARVHVTDGGCGRTAAVIALGPHAPGDVARRDRRPASHRVSLIKHVTVVDDDVDVADADAVAWAVATRLRPERDLELASRPACRPRGAARASTAP